MPAYDMQCDKCEHAWEVLRPITEGPPKTCPKCKSKKVKQNYRFTSEVTGYSFGHYRRFRGKGVAAPTGAHGRSG